MSEKKPFAYFEGEDPDQTAAYIAGLETDLAGRKSRGEDTKDVVAELKRMGVGPKERTPAKETRLRGESVEKRA
jgi:hypothetical protein